MRQRLRQILQYANRPLPGTEQLAAKLQLPKARFAGAVISAAILLIFMACSAYMSVSAAVIVGRYVRNLARFGLEVHPAHWLVPIVPSLITLILLAAFIKSLLTARRLGRALHGSCEVCGYDLRATPDRCPECGTVAVKAPLESN